LGCWLTTIGVPSECTWRISPLGIEFQGVLVQPLKGYSSIVPSSCSISLGVPTNKILSNWNDPSKSGGSWHCMLPKGWNFLRYGVHGSSISLIVLVIGQGHWEIVSICHLYDIQPMGVVCDFLGDFGCGSCFVSTRRFCIPTQELTVDTAAIFLCWYWQLSKF